jgi:hypothetical protein
LRTAWVCCRLASERTSITSFRRMNLLHRRISLFRLEAIAGAKRIPA